MKNPLEPLLTDGVIDEVLSRLKSGKEADLWLVRRGQAVVAAKVYKARQVRSFKHHSAYLEGRRVRNTRTQRAMDRGSRFGQAAAEEAWKTKEADALHALHAAGVRVPRPVLFYEGVLLMEVVVDAAGHPAPRLIDALVSREQAAGLYAGLRSQVVRMLCCDLVHGDLSPYNVLLGWDGPVIIDFPQVVGAAHNSQAEGFFFRDLANLRHFFEAIDPELRASAGDAREIWRAYTKRELTPDFVPPPPQSRPLQRPQPPPHQERSSQPRSPQLPVQNRPAQPQRSLPRRHQRLPQQPAQPRTAQAQRPAQPQRTGQAPQQQPQRPGQPQRQLRRQDQGRARPAGPIVERRPVLGAQAVPQAPQAAKSTEGGSGPPGASGQGRKRRRRRGRRGGGGAGGGGAQPR